jgi:predicted LPLAT superfamily acyltransferase
MVGAPRPAAVMGIKAEPARASRAEWASHRERGSVILLRMMTFVSLHLGRRAGRCILYLIAAYFFAFAPTARRHSIVYLERVLGRKPTAADRFRHVLTFATTIHDRVYLANERFDLFDVSIEGEDIMHAALEAGKGGFMIGSHVGSFEIIHSLGRREPGLHMAMAMYEPHAQKVNAMLAAINPNAKPDLITIGKMDAMLRIREALDRGFFVGILGDRTPGTEPTETVPFLGVPASFPVGPLRAAAIMRRPVIFMVGLYRGGNRYHVVFETLADFTTTPSGRRAQAVRCALENYAALLEKHCRRDPYNWFNFYDFWQEAHRA